MARKLVVCCDGTWNDEEDGTNIRRTYVTLREQLVAPVILGDVKDGWETAGSDEAVLYYDQGVGTNWWSRVVGGSVGAGLSRNVCQAYAFLCAQYRPGDEIYVFGFSRGAYTARSLGGFIARVGGLLPAEISRGAVARAYLQHYVLPDNLLGERGTQSEREARQELADELKPDGHRSETDLARKVRIRLMGVYDTVGALGVPTPVLGELGRPLVRFHDTHLGSLIEHAVHALAVDERRVPFEPTLWTMPSGGMAPGQTCLQVWFPGVHSDVGGGYPATVASRGIADITFDFMMRQAAERGLVLSRATLDEADPWGVAPLQELPSQHDSFSKWYKLHAGLFGPGKEGLQRPIGQSQRGGAAVAGLEMLHPSLTRRWGRSVQTLFDQAAPKEAIYAPGSLAWPVEVAGRKPVDVSVFALRDELRLPVQAAASIDGKTCRLLDRSSRGVRISSDDPPKAGGRVVLDGRAYRVVWARGKEAGLRLAA